MSEQRVLALPSTEDPNAPVNRRRKLSDDYLELAMKVVKKTLGSEDEKLAWDAAKWVSEMVMGKPKQEIEQSGGVEAEMAKMLGAAYAAHLGAQAALPPIREGEVVILGGPLREEEEPAQELPVIEMVEKKPHTTRTWDALPE